MSRITGTGFGSGPFGRGPFGRSDFGEITVIKSFAESYLEKDPQNGDRLQHYLLTLKDSVNRVEKSITEIQDVIDPIKVREDLLRFLGTTIDVVLDDAEPPEYARSLVNNAVLYYRIKGTEEAYRIRGKISGFDVFVVNVYRFDYNAYSQYLDPNNIFEIPFNSGKFFTDVPPGSVSGIPETAQCDYCLTSFIKLTFLVLKPLPPSASINFFDRLIRKLKEITPIHIRDILYELQLVILIDEHQYLDLQSYSEEFNYIPMHIFNRFDAIPGDNIATDLRGAFISGYVETVP